MYAGGLNWYLQSLGSKQDNLAITDEKIIVENVQTLPSDHPHKKIIGDWEYWQTLKGHTKGINCLAYTIKTLVVKDH